MVQEHPTNKPIYRMEEYLRAIDQQLVFNQGKNIFKEDADKPLSFVVETITAVSSMNQIDREQEEILIDHVTDKAIEEFCRMNQYYAFNTAAKNDLRNIYRDLFHNLRGNAHPLKTIEKNHYENLKQWLQNTNPFAGVLYANAESEINPVACAEYAADLQFEVLHLDLETMMEPLLDIGCGREGNLVKYLNSVGIEAYGIDRFSFSDTFLLQADWLEYNYGTGKWGTITSNLGFSNHFKHHHLRADGNYLEYGKKYMEILTSLKTGGSFHYAPDLPFIEQFLESEKFRIKQYHIDTSGFKTSRITSIK
jgi:hypothetical protein